MQQDSAPDDQGCVGGFGKYGCGGIATPWSAGREYSPVRLPLENRRVAPLRKWEFQGAAVGRPEAGHLTELATPSRVESSFSRR